jgi:hypothetical protein
METMLTEFDYFTPTLLQSSIVSEYDEMISPTGAINPDAAGPLSTIEFNIPGTADLYRDLNNSYLMLKLKLVVAAGTAVAADVKAAPTNLPLHSMFSNVSVTLCGKEISEKDSLYPYRAYLETLLTYEKGVLDTRCVAEGWAKDDADQMENLTLAVASGVNPNSGFVTRQKLVASSRVFTLVGRPHVDLFHQNLDMPPNCPISIKFTPSPRAFSLMEANNGTDKFVLVEAKLFVRTKQVNPELVLAHKATLQKANMRFPMNRVTVGKHGIAAGFKSVTVPLNFPSKLPKRLFIGLVTNTACTGTLAENPFNFQPFGLETLSIKVNGVQIPAVGLQTDFATKDYWRAYMNTLAALELDNSNRAITLSGSDFATGYTIFGFKVAPGPVDGAIFNAANSNGSIVVTATFSTALTANVDMIVYAETPSILEIDKLSSVTIV